LAEIFKDINASVRGVQVVCITSKVTTGADIQEKFYRIYAHCNTWHGPTARDVGQMLGRVRSVENIEMIVVLPRSTKAQSSANQELQKLNGYQTARKNYTAMASCKLILGPDGKIGWSASWLLKLASHHAAEESEDFCAAFHRHTLRKGYKFVDPTPFMCGDNNKPLDEVKESRLLHKKESKKSATDLLVKLQAKTWWELKVEMKELSAKPKDDWTAVDKAKFDMYHVLQRFPE